MKTFTIAVASCLASMLYAQGLWADIGVADEYCITQYADAAGIGTYKGPCDNNLPQGAGTVTFSHGASLVGEFAAGDIRGPVVYRAADGSVYEGSWQQGNRHGQGVYRWAQGSSYEGEWLQDKRHGEGVFTWSNGNRFVGNFKNNKRYNGSYYTSNGYVYKCRLGQCK